MSDFFENGGNESASAALERRMKAAERAERKTRGLASAVVAGVMAAVLIFGGGVAASALARKPAPAPATITVPAKQAKAKHKAKSKKTSKSTSRAKRSTKTASKTS